MGEIPLRPSIGWLRIHGNWSLMSERVKRVFEVILYLISYVEEAHKSTTTLFPIPPLPNYSSFESESFITKCLCLCLDFINFFTKDTGTTHSWNALLTERANKTWCRRHPLLTIREVLAVFLHDNRVICCMHNNRTCAIGKEFKTGSGWGLFICNEVMWCVLFV